MMTVEKMKEAVEQLYRFRDRYFESHDIEHAAHKQEDVKAEMERTLKLLEELEGGVSEKAEALMLKGQALNVLSSCSSEAEQLLSSAVKLDPTLFQAWNHLGEAAWKKDDVDQAKDCFEGALRQNRNKWSLRRLSMALRQVPGPPGERRGRVEESVGLAREALQLDAADGTSWYILGNAYLSQFFLCGQDPKTLKQCMGAYAQAEKDIVAKTNPDLHFNKATVERYEEDYVAALASYDLAARLEPVWSDPRDKRDQLARYLTSTAELIAVKGKLRQKKIEQLRQALKPADLGPYSGGKYTAQTGKSIKLDQVALSELSEGENKEKVVLGKVVCSVATDDPPFTFCLLGANNECVAVTLYNLAPGAGVKIGDSVAIPEPFYTRVALTAGDKEVEFHSIRVSSPLVLVVNGRKLSREHAAPAVLAVQVQPE